MHAQNDSDMYPTIIVFDADTNHLNWWQVIYDPQQLFYTFNIEILDVDSSYLFRNDDERLMRSLGANQFKVYINNELIEPDSVEYEDERLLLYIRTRIADIRNIVVFFNSNPNFTKWEIPRVLRMAYK
jgi:hypothetical protein